jgi:hypothetical protein
LTVRLSEVELAGYWSEADPTLRGRIALTMHRATGTASIAVI